MTIWHFKQRGSIIESLAWKTDVFQAKAGEQRIALRAAPRRTFNLNHYMTDYEYATARTMIRADQGSAGFLVPDWNQSITVGAVAAGSSVVVTTDPDYINLGTVAMLWESSTLYEEVALTIGSPDVTAATVVNTYTNAKLVPLWTGYCPNGLAETRNPKQINETSVEMEVYENQDLALSTYTQYRSHDVLESNPVIGNGNMVEGIAWPVSVSDNQTSVPEYLRARTIPNYSFFMRWHETTTQGIYQLRQWLHSRRGRQKVFWFSSRAYDFEPAVSITSTTVTVFRQEAMPVANFDIDITTTAGVSSYYQVTAVANGTDVSGRTTTDFTITPSASITLAEIERISFLRCTRFSADRVEFLHVPGEGTRVQMPCIEVPVP